MFLFSKSTSPASGFINPVIKLNIVDFPTPLGPRIPSISP